MLILDTNVILELLRPSPEPRVESWLAAQEGRTVYLTAVTEAELRYGVAIMGNGKRQVALTDAIDRILRIDFAGRVLPFDSGAAEAFAEVAAMRRAAGRPISQADCQIAAIARIRGAVLATRNTADFEGFGVELIEPWRHQVSR